MTWVILLTIAVTAGALFGLIAAVGTNRGVTSGRRTALLLAAAFALTGSIAYMAYLKTRTGGLAPDDFLNSVLGNVVVVGGMIASFGALLGIVLAYLTVLKR